jgi:hypothetical protein
MQAILGIAALLASLGVLRTDVFDVIDCLREVDALPSVRFAAADCIIQHSIRCVLIVRTT